MRLRSTSRGQKRGVRSRWIEQNAVASMLIFESSSVSMITRDLSTNPLCVPYDCRVKSRHVPAYLLSGSKISSHVNARRCLWGKTLYLSMISNRWRIKVSFQNADYSNNHSMFSTLGCGMSKGGGGMNTTSWIIFKIRVCNTWCMLDKKIYTPVASIFKGHSTENTNGISKERK